LMAGGIFDRPFSRQILSCADLENVSLPEHHAAPDEGG